MKEIAKYKKNHDVRIVYDCFDLWPESMPISKNKKRLLTMPFNIWANLRDNYIDSGDMLLCVADAAKELMQNKYPNMHIEVLRPSIQETGVPDYDFDVNREINCCYLGNINYITDIELGVQILSCLAMSKKVTLHIIGGGINLDQFVSELEDKDVHVVEHGCIFDVEEKKKIFEMCDFGINIPKEEVNSAMALKFVEYLHVGLPIINSGLGDNHVAVGQRNLGINIDRDDIVGTAERILGLGTDKLLKMHQNCLEYYNDFFVNQNIDKILFGSRN
ncbi:MAG: glycosyltransferase [Prevotella sp.]|nr:glycosyltransferase [Prevotella sp.]